MTFLTTQGPHVVLGLFSHTQKGNFINAVSGLIFRICGGSGFLRKTSGIWHCLTPKLKHEVIPGSVTAGQGGICRCWGFGGSCMQPDFGDSVFMVG